MVALFIIFALIAVCSLGFIIYKAVKVIKNPMPKTIDYKKEVKIALIAGLTNVVSFTVMMGVIYPWCNIIPTAGEVVQAVIGALFTSASFVTFIYAFFVHYYAKEIPEKLNKILFLSAVISVPVCLIFFFLMTNGYAEYLIYPLVNGLNFEKGFVTPFSGTKPNIAFYAILILSGALLTYVICDHRMYVQFGKHGILESTFLVAFPAGILGARIFFVIGDWAKFASRVAAGEWWAIFAIWEGGLTILGGAIVGIVVGVLWYLWKNKKYNAWVAVDIIVPTILVAQGVGRFGNFFNCEVHGIAASASDYLWLPSVILKNMQFSEFGMRTLPDGQIFVPLFLIEAIFNILGYFVIEWLFGRALRKYTEFGDLAFSYLIWYGFTRVFMEPLRDTPYNMGSDGYWSWFWSIMFVVGGAILIAGNHVIRFILRKKKEGYTPKINHYNGGLISTVVIATLSLGFIISGSVLMATNEFVKTISLNNFNLGVVLLSTGVSVLFFIAASILYLIDGVKAKKLQVSEAK